LDSGGIVAIHLKECVFCEKKWLLRDIDVDMPLFGENGSRLERGVCISCSEDLLEIPSVDHQNFSYNKLVRVSDINPRSYGPRGDWKQKAHAAVRLHIEKGTDLYAFSPDDFNQETGTNGEPSYYLTSPMIWRLERAGINIHSKMSKEFKEPLELEKLVSDVIDSRCSNLRLGVRCLYRINLECVIGEKCDSKSGELIYIADRFAEDEVQLGLPEVDLHEDFPQEHIFQQITCCGERQIFRNLRLPNISGRFCRRRHEPKHQCACKERDIHDDIEEAWRTHRWGHVNRGRSRRSREKGAFVEACCEHDEDHHEIDEILSARYKSLGQATGSSTMAGKWRKEGEFDCAELEECSITPTKWAISIDIPGKMIGSGYICIECYGE
jgi:hypothetical protein